jgi:hypothetical protein
MARPTVILARRDSKCGKAFHIDRRSANEHRIVLEIWYRATRPDPARSCPRLLIIRCKQCGGFHLSQKRPIEGAASTRARAECHDSDKTDVENEIGLAVAMIQTEPPPHEATNGGPAASGASAIRFC